MSERPTPPSRPLHEPESSPVSQRTMRYSIPIMLAILGGSGGVGGFIGAQAQIERMADDIAEIKAEMKSFTRQMASNDTRLSLMEREVADCRAQIEELKQTIKEVRR